MPKKTLLEPLRFQEVQFGGPAYDEVTALREKALFGLYKATLPLKGLKEEYNERHFSLYDASDRLLAAGSVHQEDLEDAPPTLRFYQIVVQKEWQKKGLGRRMVEQLEQLARREGIHQAYLEVPEPVIPFFQSLSYKKYGRGFKLQKVKHYRMKKELLHNKG